MDAPTAALIGAGTAAIVSIGAQFLAHRLAGRRDVRNQRRERLFAVIVEAASALYEPMSKPSPADPEEPPPMPGSMAALDPTLRDPSVRAFQENASRGLVLLMVHFGHDHHLIHSYIDAWTECSKAEYAKARHFASDNVAARTDEIPELAKTLRAGQIARDTWMNSARAYVEGL